MSQKLPALSDISSAAAFASSTLTNPDVEALPPILGTIQKC